MTVVRTFLDAGVLITAARGTTDDAEKALRLLKAPNREFVASQFLKLEVLPKAIFNQKNLEAEFYETYFEAVTHWATDIQQLLEAGYREATDFGLGAMDALHVAAAVAAGADEFITSEKPTKSIYRTPSIPVISL
ncbi:MAG: PIN domain-containing protein [Cyanobacteria bacterium J06633_23]